MENTPQKNTFSDKILKSLLDGELAAPNDICADLVQDARSILENLKKQEALIQENERRLQESKGILSEMIGAYNKTISDLKKWWIRYEEKHPKEKS
jgi:hypothetical protein